MSDNVLAGWSVLTEWPRLRLGHSVRTDRQLVHYPILNFGIFPRSWKSWSWTSSFEIKNGKQAAFKPKTCSEMGLRYRRRETIGQDPSAGSAKSLFGRDRRNERRPNLAASDFCMLDNKLKFTLQAITNTTLRLTTYVDGSVHRLTVDAPSVVAHVLFATSWTRVAFHCTSVVTVGDITLFFPCSSVIYSSFGIT